MMKKIVSGMVLTLLLITMFTLEFNIQQVEASDTIYIRADGRVDPPTAPISTLDNITYILTGTVGDSIVIERSNITIDGKGYTVQGSGSGDGFGLYNINNITIKNTKIKSFLNGIDLYYSSNDSISGNTITTNNGAGILLIHSSNNNISGNTLASNSYGLYLDSSSNYNNISANAVTANSNYGIKFTDSSNITLRNNAISNNKYNFDVRGDDLLDFLNDIDVSNTVDGKPIYYWTNEQDKEVPPDAGYVALVNSTRITIQNLNLINNGQGILLSYTTNATITRNNLTNNYFGIWLWSSSDNSFYHNKFVDNSQQVFVQTGFANAWNHSYPSGGNYWSDYISVDLYSGLCQNETGSDGIGDTLHMIDANNTDHYPLMKPYAGPHDIGIKSVNTSETIVRQGDNVNITVKIINYGEQAETFNVAIKANLATLKTQELILAIRNSTTITFTWNTTGVAKGNYTISAMADTIPGEIDTGDNLFVDGYVFVLSSGHDVAILSMASSPVVGEGYTLAIEVTSMNVGNDTETFNITVSVNTIAVGSQNITLTSGTPAIVIFTWNTTGFAKGSYTLSALADTVPGETDLTDNNCTNGWVLIAKVGDLGGPVNYVPTFFVCDGKVNGYDLALCVQCYKKLASKDAMHLADLGGPVNYVPTFFACDGKVDGWDLALFVQCYKGLGP